MGVEAGGTGAILSAEPGGKIVGQDADLNALIAKKLGVKLEMVETPWPGIIPALLSQALRHDHERHDGHEGPGREGEFLDTLRRCLADRRDRSPAMPRSRRPTTWPARRWACCSAHNTVDFAKKFAARMAEQGKPAITVKTYDDFPSIFVDLTNRNIDAVMLPHPIMGGYMTQKPGAFKIIEGLGDKSYFGVGDPQGRHGAARCRQQDPDGGQGRRDAQGPRRPSGLRRPHRPAAGRPGSSRDGRPQTR